MVGRTLDRYQLLEQVGQGGMAIVYRALDVPLNREVAVKVLHPHLASQPESRARLQREAQAVAKLRHDNILEIFASSGASEGETYLVTEFIHGPTLKTFVADHPPELPEIGVMIASEIARALECAHDLGIIHRDIKPENVMIRGDGTLVLCDFGIAQVVDKERMTATGQLLGSPAYMAPEHIEGQPLDLRSDVFSLGVVLYQLVCGELPFRGRNPHETLKKITDGNFAPPTESAPLCSGRLSRVIGRAMSRDPAGRYPKVRELREDLLGVLAESGVSDPRAELRGYFKDPAGWTAAFRPRLTQALIEGGCRHKAAGRTAAALATWARAQLIAPEDPQLAGLIQSVAQRRRWRRAGAGGGALACALCALVAWHPWRPAPKRGAALQLPAPPAVSPSPPPPEAARPVAEAARPGEGPARPLEAPIPSGPPRPPAQRKLPQVRKPEARAGRGAEVPRKAPLRVVRLEPWPKAVRVSLNGKPLGDYGADVRSVELPEGPSEILFENPACYSERVSIPADADPQEIRLRLRWKPALLLVRAQGAAADVVVEGRVGRAGQVIGLPIQGDDGKAQVEIKVSAPGHQTVTRTVGVRANQLSTVDVVLEPI